MPKEKSLINELNVDWWHNGCGSYAGRTQKQVDQHRKKCYDKGRTLHAHIRKGRRSFTISVRFR